MKLKIDSIYCYIEHIRWHLSLLAIVFIREFISLVIWVKYTPKKRDWRSSFPLRIEETFSKWMIRYLELYTVYLGNLNIMNTVKASIEILQKVMLYNSFWITLFMLLGDYFYIKAAPCMFTNVIFTKVCSKQIKSDCFFLYQT